LAKRNNDIHPKADLLIKVDEPRLIIDPIYFNCWKQRNLIMTIPHTVQPGKDVNPATGALPRHLLIGYWHNWQNDHVKYIRLKDVSDDFDVVHVAFATAADPKDGRMFFMPAPETTVPEFVSDISSLQERGKKVVISVGGATGSVAIADQHAQENFANSMTSIIRQYGFDGMDINLEGKVNLDPDDTDFENPISPSIIYLVGAIRKIRANFGTNFILSMAPETTTVQGGYRQYGGVWGSFLPVIEAIRDILTYVQIQHYNSGSLIALDGMTYAQGTADFHVAMSEMLLHGFPVNGKDARFFAPLRPDQLTIGLPASANITNDGYTPPEDVRKALTYLSSGKGFGGKYTLRDPSGYPSIRGVMTWSINWDAATDFQFSHTTRTYLNMLS
jgi:chitinase